MGHTEVTKTPGKTVDDIGCRGAEQIAYKGVGCTACADDGVVQKLGVEVACDHKDQGKDQHSTQHQKTLEEVGPANGLVAAKEGVDDQNQCEDRKCQSLVHVGEQVGDHRCACHEGGGHVNSEAYQEYDGADDLQHRGLGCKAVGKVLGKGDSVIRCGREAAQTARNQDPVGNGTDGKTDTDPRLAKTEGKNAAGQTHQQPGTHIGGLCAHCGYPRAHLTATEEVILIGNALFLHKEENADADHCYKVQNEGEKLKIQNRKPHFRNRC